MDGSVYCRTCAAPSPGGDDDDIVLNTKGLNDIFANEQIKKLLSTLKEWQLDIMEDDGLPQCICETCEMALKRIDDFRIQALRAKEYLQMRLRSIVNCIATTEGVVVEVMKINNNENDLHVGDTVTKPYFNGSSPEIYHREAVLSRKRVTPPPLPKTTYEYDDSTKHVNKKINNNMASGDNGSMEKAELNDIELVACAAVVNEDGDLIEPSRPPEFQIVLIEEHEEGQLQWIIEEDEHSMAVGGEKKEDSLRNNEFGLTARTECCIGGNNNNIKKQRDADEHEGMQSNTNKNIAIKNQHTKVNKNLENSSNKQAQEEVDVVINENSQYEACVQEERETQINTKAKANTEHILHGIAQRKNGLGHEQEGCKINDPDSYLAEGCYVGSNLQNFQGLILPLKQQHAHNEVNDHDTYLATDCDAAQRKMKCTGSDHQSFRDVNLPLKQQQHQSEINLKTNFTIDLLPSLDEDLIGKHKNYNNKSPGMHTEITKTTTEMSLQHLTNPNEKLIHEEHTQIKEFQALLAALNEQVSAFETNSNYSCGDLDLDLQSIFMNDLTLQMINANVNIIEEDLQIDQLETLLSLPVDDADEDKTVLELSEEKTRNIINERTEHNSEVNNANIFAESKNESWQAESQYHNQQDVEYYGSNKSANRSRDLKQTTTNLTTTETVSKNYEHEQLEDFTQCQITTTKQEHSSLEKYVDDDSGMSLVLEDKLINEPLSDYLSIDNTSFSNSLNSNFTPTTTTIITLVDNHNNKLHKPTNTATCARGRRRSSAVIPPHNKKNSKITNILRCRFCVCKISEQPIFPTTHLLDQHIATIHDDKDRPYNCPQCAARYRTRSGCVAHINAIHLKKFENCKLCNKIVAGGSGQMRMHIERNHTHGNYTCEICHLELKNVTLYNFKYHKRWHDEGKLWRCELCEKAFVTRTHLMAHKVTHTRQGEFLCTRCGKSTRSNWELRTHLYAIHGEGDAPLQCNYCDEKFTQHIQKRVHIERYHPNEQQTKRTTVPCSKCDKQFSTEINLQRHIKKHHNEGSFDILMKKVAAASSPPQYEGFMCAHCPRKYRSKYALIKHLRVHTKMPDKPYSCPDCYMHFKHFSELDRHDLQHHATVRPYKCDECAKRFSTRTALKIHRRIHEVKGRNFRCPECDQRFKFEKSLNLHRLSHKTMRHSCDICNKSYIRLTQLKTHKHRYHQIQSDSEEE